MTFGAVRKRKGLRPGKGRQHDAQSGRRKKWAYVQLSLEALESRLTPSLISWNNAAGGDWDTPTNWSPQQVPAAADDAVINISTSAPITHANANADVVNSLTSSSTVALAFSSGSLLVSGAASLSGNLTLSGGALKATGTLQVNGTFLLTGGTLADTTVSSPTTITGTTSGGTLSGVTLNGNLDLTAAGSGLTITNGLTLNGTATVGGGGSANFAGLGFSGTQTLGGNGSVLFNGSTQTTNGYPLTALVATVSNTTLTIGPNLTLHGGRAEIGFDSSGRWGGGSNVSLVVQGTINADVAGQTLYVYGTNWSNSGTLETSGGNLRLDGSWTTSTPLVAGGGALIALGTWTATGGLTANSGTLSLDGTATWASSASLSAAAGAVVSFDSGSTTLSNPLTLSGAGRFQIAGASLGDGSVNFAGGASTLFGTSSGGTLSGVTLNGNLDLTAAGSGLNITNGLTLNGTATVGGGGSGNFAGLGFSGTQTLGGTGSVLFNGSTQTTNGYPLTALVATVSNTTLTIGPNLTLHGGRAEIGFDSSGRWGGGSNISLVVQGTINADVAGQTLYVYGTNWSNSGTLETSGGNLRLDGSWTTSTPLIAGGGALITLGTWTTTAALTANAGTVSLNGTGTWASSDAITAAPGATVSFDSGSTTLSNPLTLSGAGRFQIAGNSLSGGTVGFAGGASTLFVTSSGGTLNGLTLNGNLDLTTAGSTLTVTNGLTLNGIATVGGGGGGNYAALLFSGTQTLGGTGSVLFNGSTQTGLGGVPFTGLVLTVSSTTITVGPNMTLHGGRAEIGLDAAGHWAAGSNFSLVVQGTINADVVGQTLFVNGSNWSNSGTLETSGGNLRLDGSWTTSTAPVVGGGTLITLGTWTTTAGVTANAGTLSLNGTTNWTAAAPLAAASGATVSFDSGSLNLSSPLVLSGPGRFQMAGGSLNSGTVNFVGGASTVFGTVSGGTLNGLTLNGILDLTASGSTLTVTNGLTLNGTATVGGGGSGNYAGLLFSGTQTLGGTGSVLFNGSTQASLGGVPFTGLVLTASNTTLTIGPTMTLHGGRAEIGLDAAGHWTAGSNVSLVVQGTINADVAGQTLYVYGTNWSNSGTLETSGGNLRLDGSWSTSTPLTAAGGTLITLGAWTTTAALTANAGTLSLNGAGTWASSDPVSAAAGATVSFDSGSMSLSNPLTLSGTGRFQMAGGSVTGGTVNFASGASTLVGTTGGGTLSGVSLNGNLDLTTAGSNLTVTNGLTLNGVASVGGSGSLNLAGLLFSGTQTLSGTGSVLFNGSTQNGVGGIPFTGLVLTVSNTTLTIGPTMTLHGGRAEIGLDAAGHWTAGSNVSLVVQGTINADVAGQTLFVNGSNWTNNGITQAQNGGTLNLQGTIANFATGTLSGGAWQVFGNSTLRLNTSGIVTNAATILLDGSGSNLLQSSGTDALAGFATNDVAGSFTVQNGRNFTPGAFFNLGSLTVGTGSTFTVSGGGGYNQNSGTTVVTGGLNVNSSTLNFNGGSVAGSPLLFNSALTIGAGSTEAASFTLQGSCTLKGNVAAAQTLWVQGNNAGGNATLTDVGDITNHGTILLQSINNTWSEALSTSGGTFTNAADGTLQVMAGTGGSRTITDTLVNQGQISVESASLLTIQGTYSAAGGNISGPGYLYGCTLDVTASPATPTTILIAAGGVTLATNNLANTTLWVQGNSPFNNATLTVAPGLTNHGTILLESISNTFSETLATGSGTFTNAADGTIQVIANAGGSRTLTGTLVNQGQISVDNASLLTIQGTYYAAGGNISGPGYLYSCTLDVTISPATPTTILIAAGGVTLATNNLANTTLWVQGNSPFNNATLTVAPGLTNHGTILLQSINNTFSEALATGSGTFTNAADGTIQVLAGTGGSRTLTGTLVNQGQISVENASLLTIQGTYYAVGGNISGPGYLYSCTLDVTASPATPTTILIAGGGVTLATDNLANTTLWVQGNSPFNNATLTVAPGLTNHGLMLLESINSTYAETLATGSGTFTNAADGTIQVIAYAGGSRTLTGTLVNQGQISVENASLLTIQGAYYAAGGNISGPGYLISCALNVTASPATPTTILIAAGGVTLATNNLPNTTLWVQGNSAFNNATLTVAPELANHGTILLQSINNTFGETLATGSSTFTNAADGTIQVLAGTGGGRTIQGAVANVGTMYFTANASLGNSGANHFNSGLLSITGATVIVTGASFTNGAGGLISGDGTFNTSGVAFVNNGILDFSPPSILAVDAESGFIAITYDSASGMNVSTVTNPANYVLLGSGGDGIFGNGNDVDESGLISPTIPYNSATGTATLQLTSPLPPDVYRVEVNGDAVRDASGTKLLSGQVDQVNRFVGLVPTPLTITTGTLSGGNVSTAYAQTINALGGAGSYTFSQTAGTLPTGLTLTSQGVLSGTPSAAGSYTFTISVSDGFGSSASQSYTVVISPALIITTTALPAWTVNQAGYNQTILATGGTGTPTFSAAGTLPPGLVLSTSGILSGTPTTLGAYTFTVTATDTLGISNSQAYTVTINSQVTITTTSLFNWTVNIAGYNQTIHAGGGTSPVAFATTTGTLPTGLSLSSTGVLSGKPTATGSFAFTITATDAVGVSVSQSYTISINVSASVSWTGSAGTFNWGDAHNWSMSAVPDPTSNVTISAAVSGSITITGTQFINSLTDTSAALVLGSGSLTLAAGSSISKNLTVSSGTLTPSGGLSVNSATLNFNGGAIAGTVLLSNSALVIGAGSTGTAGFTLQGSCTLAGSVAAGQTVWVQGNSALGNATLSAAGNIINHGIILLEAIGLNWNVTLATGSATLTNAADGTIQVSHNTGGARTISGTIVNQGAITITGGTSPIIIGTVTNQAQISVDSASFLRLEGTYNAAGGAISGPGYLSSCTLNVTAAPSAPTTILIGGINVTLATNNPANMILAVQGSFALGNATLTVAPGLINHGTIALHAVDSNFNATLSINGTFTNASDGTLQMIRATGGGRTISGTLVNQGTITATGGTSAIITGTQTNQGQINVDSSSFLQLQGTYNFAGGTISGPGYLSNSTLNVTTTPAVPTTILIGGTNVTLATNNPANMTLAVQGSFALGNTTLTVAAGLTNHGIIALQAIDSNFNAILSISGTFTNASDGTLQMIRATGGGRTISATLVNQGTITVTGGTSAIITGTQSNQGQISVDSGSLLQLQGTYNEMGGTISGPGYLTNCTLNVISLPFTPSTILIGGTNVALATNNPANLTLAVQGSNAFGHATLAVAAGLTNHGTIALQAVDSNFNATLSITGTFTNAPDGTLQIIRSTGGGRTISGTLVNQGAITVTGGTFAIITGATTNQASINVDGASLLQLQGNYNEMGGTISGPGYLTNCTLNVISLPATPTTILIGGTNVALATNNPANLTLAVQGSNAFSHATLTVAAGLTNHGTIALQAVDSNFNANLSINGTFTNAADGTLQMIRATGGGRTISGTLVNQGTITVTGGTSAIITGSTTNQGQISVDGGSLLQLQGIYNETGGTISGPGYLTNCTLNVISLPATPTTILIGGTNVALATNNPANLTLAVQGSNAFGHATLTVATGLTNHGTIALQAVDSNFNANLSINGTLTNASDGKIRALTGTGGARTITGSITNQGTINFYTSTNLGSAGAKYLNLGLISMTNATVTVSATSFTNAVGGLISGDGTFNTSGVAFVNNGILDLTRPSLLGVDAELFFVTITYDSTAGMNVSTVTSAANYLLLGSGGDGIFGNGNDVDESSLISSTVLYDSTTSTATLQLTSPLPTDVYRVEVDGDKVLDASGAKLLSGQQDQVNRFVGVVPPPIMFTTLTLANGDMSAGYAQTIAAAGGTGSYTFSQTAGNLPTGLSLSSAGVLSGTPSATGSFTFTVTAGDNYGDSASQSFTVVINPAVTITTTLLPNGEINVPYSQVIHVAGGSGSYTFKPTGGTFPPPGVTLSANGVLSGTPTSAATYMFFVEADDSLGGSSVEFYTVVISSGVTITSTLPGGTVGDLYVQTITAAGGTGSFTFSMTGGTLPTGLTLSSGGVLSGTPTSAGTFSFTVTATDSIGGKGGQGFALLINPGGGWIPLVNQAPAGTGTMLLLTDGTVLMQQAGPSSTWYKLTPDSSGTFFDGTWSTIAAMSTPREFGGSVVLPSGKLLFVGGEYSDGSSIATELNTGEIYDPVANHWSAILPFPQSAFGDGSLELLASGKVLAGYLDGPQTYLYDPATDVWTASGTKLRADRSDEESWVKLPDGSILSYDIWASISSGTSTAQRYVPASQTWVNADTLPVALSSSPENELGPGVLLPDGRVFFIGATGNTALYSPASNTWTAGPVIPGGYVADDAPAAVLPGGHMIFAADKPAYTPGTILFDYDPSAGTITQMSLADGLALQLGNYPASAERMLILPSGELLLTNSTNQLWIYNAQAAPADAWRPTITSIVPDGTATYKLTGTQLNGLSEGASYGDDAQMASNYPIVQLQSGGTVTTARTINWTSQVATGSAAVSTDFVLPAGLPAGLYSLRVIANGIASAAVPFTVVTISPAAPGFSLTQNFAFSQTLTATGVSGGYTFTEAGVLPSGVMLSTAGVLSGTPTVSGTFNFTVTVADSAGNHAARSYTLVVNPGLSITPAVLANWTMNVPNYGQTLIASGGTGTKTFSLSGTLPTGLSLNGASGVIAGTPSTVGSYSFTITATDGVGATSSQHYTVVINPPVAITTPSLTGGVYQQSYSLTIQASGGTGTITFTVSGTLPPGLTLSSGGVLSGTPSAAGSFAFTVIAQDPLGSITNHDYTLVVNLGLTPTTLPNYTAGIAGYSQTIVGGGGSTMLTYSSTGTLPPGLNLNSSIGVLAGTPSQPGSYAFTVIATDAAGLTGSRTYSVTINPAVTITTTAIASGTFGQPYAQLIVAGGGTGPLTFSYSGTLPAGVTLTSSGLLSGTPSVTGNFSFTVTASDGLGSTASQAYFLNVNLAVAPANLAPWTANIAGYHQTISASGQTGAVTFSSSGSLPPGLVLDNSTGVLSGTPLLAGTYTFTITATDARPVSGNHSYTVTINPPVAITTAALPGWTVGKTGYRQTIFASGGTGVLTFSASGSLPVGLAMSGNGVLSGTPSVVKSYTFSVTATDLLGSGGSQSYAVTINAPLSLGVTSLGQFAGTNGNSPSGLVEDAGGNLFGTTSQGGPADKGTLYEIARNSGTITVLATFSGANGANPQGNLIKDAGGNLFGDTFGGGDFNSGTIFELPAGSGTLTTLASFNSANGANPQAGLVMDASGNLFGTTSQGGAVGSGSIFEIQAGSSTITTLASFNGSIGANPRGGLVEDASGDLFGTTSTGGLFGYGTVFELPHGTSTITVLVTFTSLNGGTPQAGLIQDSAGNLYGTTSNGGLTASGSGFGTVFEVKNDHGAWTLTTPATFDGNNGANPSGSLVRDASGNLFGTTAQGGSSDNGTIFEVTSGTIGIVTLASFNGINGLYPQANLVLDGSGNLFGTTALGGSGYTGLLTGSGTVFEVITTLPRATANQPYSQIFQASGGTDTATFTAANLPPGLGVSSTGVLSGAPASAGTYTFTVTATDMGGASDSHTYTLTVDPGLGISTAVLANGTVLQQYFQTISTVGGSGSYTYSAAGQLPSGLTLTSAGRLTGTPSSAGNYTFTVTVTDSTGATASRSYTVIVFGLSALTHPAWTVNAPGYNEMITASGGSGPFTFSETYDLPPGLILSSTGVLAGTPTKVGTYTFLVTVADAAGAMATQPYVVTINPTLIIATTTLPNWMVNQDLPKFFQIIGALGGTGSKSFAVTSGALPTGLALNSSGLLSGEPIQLGTYTFTVTATDAGGASASQSYTIVIDNLMHNPLTDPTPLQEVMVGANAPQGLPGPGGATYSVTTGPLPTGMMLSSDGILSGAPTVPGTYEFTVAITDASGHTTLVKYSITVKPGPLSQFEVTPTSMTVAAGSSFLVAVQGLDLLEEPVTDGGITSVSADLISITGAVYTYNVPLTNGLGLFLANAPAAGSYMISVAAAGAGPLAKVPSLSGSAGPLVVTPGPAVRTAFTPPVFSSAVIGGTLPEVDVQVTDKFGNIVTGDSTDFVTLAVASGPSGAGFAPGSTLTAPVLGGVAHFTNLHLNVPGTYTLRAQVPSQFTGPDSPPLTVAPLQVVPGSFAGSASGFTLQFNTAYLVNSVTPVLYGQGFGVHAPAPSVSLTRVLDGAGHPVQDAINGSLLLDPSSNSLRFLATDTALATDNLGWPILPDGTYLADVAAGGFQAQSAGGGFLDGLGTGAPGSGDFTGTFTVNAAATGQDVLWAPATADGPGQTLSAPGLNQVGGGYPIYLSDSTGAVTDVQVTLNYDPTLLTVMGVTGAHFSLDASTPGHAVLHYSGPALSAGNTPIGFVSAVVPSGTLANPMPYRAKDLLHLSDALVNGGEIAVTTSDAIHLVAYVGDGDGNGSYSSADAVLVTRVALQTDSGFAAYPLVDPIIVADSDGSGFIPADAGLQVNEAGVNLPTANLANPAIPPGVHFQPIGNNVDPILSLAVRGLGSGVSDGTVPVEVNIDDAHPDGSTGLIEAHLALRYDPRQFQVSAADIHLGSLLAEGTGWSVVPTINQVTGEIALALSSTSPITSTQSGSLVVIDFHPIPGTSTPVANAPGSPIALVYAVNPTGNQVVTTELEDAQGTFTLTTVPESSVAFQLANGGYWSLLNTPAVLADLRARDLFFETLLPSRLDLLDQCFAEADLENW
jgi:uncharacterized repeat protein (TIGR03803 family)